MYSNKIGNDVLEQGQIECHCEILLDLVIYTSIKILLLNIVTVINDY